MSQSFRKKLTLVFIQLFLHSCVFHLHCVTLSTQTDLSHSGQQTEFCSVLQMSFIKSFYTQVMSESETNQHRGEEWSIHTINVLSGYFVSNFTFSHRFTVHIHSILK